MLTISKTKNIFSAAILGGLLSTTAHAGEVTASKEVKAVETPELKSCISGDLGVAVVSKYFSRGIQLENQGVIAQPYADLYFKLYEGEGFISKVTLNLGIWSSLHSHDQPSIGGGTNLQSWYEFDYTPGISVVMAKNLTATLSYFEFDSPADNFSPARSINLNLAYDDTAMLGKFALHPHVAVLAEIGDTVAGLAPGGWYYEIGIAPSFAAGPVTFTFPINVGLGDDNFYAGETYGYASGGVTVSTPLSFVPACYGTWTASASATYLNLGDHTTAVNVGKSDDFVFGGSVGLAF
ncbi:MAG: hypothetical protein ABIT76_05525 [Chthoniobacterales bacterium]